MKKLIFIAACICAFMYIFILKHQSSSTEENVETVEAEVDETQLEKEDTNVNGNHLTFKGVPIDGTLKNFVRRMERLAFITTEIKVERLCLQVTSLDIKVAQSLSLH